jgi:hypothetical protein
MKKALHEGAFFISCRTANRERHDPRVIATGTLRNAVDVAG